MQMKNYRMQMKNFPMQMNKIEYCNVSHAINNGDYGPTWGGQMERQQLSNQCGLPKFEGFKVTLVLHSPNLQKL